MGRWGSETEHWQKGQAAESAAVLYSNTSSTTAGAFSPGWYAAAPFRVQPAGRQKRDKVSQFNWRRRFRSHSDFASAPELTDGELAAKLTHHLAA